MKVVTKVLLFAVLAVGLVFARSGKNNPIAGKKNIKIEHSYSFIKDHSANNGDQLDRKRSHKRRRKIRKPIKGLR